MEDRKNSVNNLLDSLPMWSMGQKVFYMNWRVAGGKGSELEGMLRGSTVRRKAESSPVYSRIPG